MVLVFLFAFASAVLMIASAAHAVTFGTVLATACFVALATGVFVAAMRMAKHWEDEGDQPSS